MRASIGEQAIHKLMEAVDSFIPTPVRDLDKPFLMPVEDVFTITGRGTVATGRVERGVVNTRRPGGDRRLGETPQHGHHRHRDVPQELDRGEAGDNIGLLLRGIKKEEIERGQVIVEAEVGDPAHDFSARAYILKKEEGGRHKPFFDGYRPQFYFRTTDVTGAIKLPKEMEMVMPGDQHHRDRHPPDLRRHGGPKWAPVRHPRGW
jgi:elongation factor Tu